MIKKCKYSNYFFNCTLNIKILLLLSSTVGLNTLPGQYYFEDDNLHHRYYARKRNETREIELGNSELLLNGTSDFIKSTWQPVNNQPQLQLNDRHYAYFCPNGTLEVKTIESILLNLEADHLESFPAKLAALIDSFCQSEDKYKVNLREHFLLHKRNKQGKTIIDPDTKVNAFQQKLNPGALISITKNGKEFGEIVYDKKLILVTHSAENPLYLSEKRNSISLWASLVRQNPDEGMGIPLKKYPESRGKIFLNRSRCALRNTVGFFLSYPLYKFAYENKSFLHLIRKELEKIHTVGLIKVISCFYEYQLFPFLIKYVDNSIEDEMLSTMKKRIKEALLHPENQHEKWFKQIKKERIENFKNNINKILDELIKPLPNQEKHNLLDLNLKELAWLFFLNDFKIPHDNQFVDFLQEQPLSKTILTEEIKKSYLSKEVSNALNEIQLKRVQEELLKKVQEELLRKQQLRREQEELLKRVQEELLRKQQLRREQIKYITKIILFPPIIFEKSMTSDLENAKITSYFLKFIPFVFLTVFHLELCRYLLNNLFASVRNILEL